MKSMLLLLASITVTTNAAFANPYEIKFVSKNSLVQSSSNGEHALLLGQGSDLLLWSTEKPTQKIETPSSFEMFPDSHINNQGEILFVHQSDTECDAVERQIDGSLTTVASIAPTLPTGLVASPDLATMICLGALDDEGESALLVGYIDATGLNISNLALYFSDGKSLTKVTDIEDSYYVPVHLEFNNARQVAFQTSNQFGNPVVTRVSFADINAPATLQRTYANVRPSTSDILLALSDGGSALTQTGHTYAFLDEDWRASRLNLTGAPQSFQVNKATFTENAGLVGSFYDKNDYNTGGAAGAFVRTNSGEYRSINCAMPNSVRYDFTNAAGQNAKGTILSEIANQNSGEMGIAVLDRTKEPLTNHYCPAKLETTYSANCGSKKMSNEQLPDTLPVGTQCVVNVHITDWAGLPLKNKIVHVTEAPVRGKTLTLKTNASGRTRFTFTVGDVTQVDGAVTVTAPYGDRKVRSYSRNIFIYPHNV